MNLKSVRSDSIVHSERSSSIEELRPIKYDLQGRIGIYFTDVTLKTIYLDIICMCM